METRHSKQMPMPHNGPRGSPVTDVLHGAPTRATATATVAPRGTETLRPLTVRFTESGMGDLPGGARWQVGLDGNFRFHSGDAVDEDARSSYGCGDSQAFMACREE